MGLATKSRLFELRVESWKVRSKAKQKYLERLLSQPTEGPREMTWRRRWIKRALREVAREQVAVGSREAFLNVYAEHLSGLKKILDSAAQEVPGDGDEKGKQTPSHP